GAIMALFLLVLMLLNLNAETEPQKPAYIKIAGGVSGGALLRVLAGALSTVAGCGAGGPPATDMGAVEDLAMVLFNEFLLPFELASVLLLTAMVGAVLIGRREA